MSLTIQKLILDAKKLAERLKERELTADSLLNETQVINKKIDEIKQYQEEVEVLNDVARQRPHPQLIASIQQENRHLREIQKENRELRAALEDHQIALEHIMSKYRQHTSAQMRNSKIDFTEIQNARDSEIIQQQAEKINEMAAVMNQAACIDDKYMDEGVEKFNRLITENKGLREMLEISVKCGSYGKSLFAPQTEDKLIQTEPSES